MTSILNNDDAVVEIDDHVFDHMTNEWLYKGIARMPMEQGYTGGYFPGRLFVESPDGSRRAELYPFELGLRIVD